MAAQREIKFRAWVPAVNAETGEDAGMCMDYDVFIRSDGTPYDLAREEFGGPNIEIEKCEHFVLMQFTGLLDMDGKEIYEGDIVRGAEFNGSYRDGVVEWSNALAGFVINSGLDEFRVDLYRQASHIHVIRHIHEPVTY